MDTITLTNLGINKEFVSKVVWVEVSSCQGRQQIVKNAMQSYPSGHTGSAFTVGVYLALYLNAKLKALGYYQSMYWKMLVCVGPLMGAGCVACLLIIDGVSFEIRPCFLNTMHLISSESTFPF